ncbi:hypothetical protein CHU98_g12254, partial [Xylaria longipes]
MMLSGLARVAPVEGEGFAIDELGDIPVANAVVEDTRLHFRDSTDMPVANNIYTQSESKYRALLRIL